MVRICQPFWIAETPVTQAQFELWTDSEKIEHENHFKGCPTHPAENMDWRQAIGFCDWLNRTRGNELPSGGYNHFCLPTEAEWEYACRATTDTEYYTGDGVAALAEAGWFDEEWGSGSTHPVRGKRPNKWSLYDMHGNVLEWCHDEWDETAYRARIDGDPDPGWKTRENDWKLGVDHMTESDLHRVLRGGSWNDSADGCRSACRNGSEPVDRFRFFGFRVCLVCGPAADRTDRVEPEPVDGGRGTRTESKGAGGAGIPDLTKERLPRLRESDE